MLVGLAYYVLPIRKCRHKRASGTEGVYPAHFPERPNRFVPEREKRLRVPPPPGGALDASHGSAQGQDASRQGRRYLICIFPSQGQLNVILANIIKKKLNFTCIAGATAVGGLRSSEVVFNAISSRDVFRHRSPFSRSARTGASKASAAARLAINKLLPDPVP